MMFIQPIAGYLGSSFGGHSTSFWGFENFLIGQLKIKCWMNYSPPFTNGEEFLLAALIVLHITATVVHIVRREWEVLERMLPGRS